MRIVIPTLYHGRQRLNLDNVILASECGTSVIFNCRDNKVIEFGESQTTEDSAVFIPMNRDMMEHLQVSLSGWG